MDTQKIIKFHMEKHHDEKGVYRFEYMDHCITILSTFDQIKEKMFDIFTNSS